MNRCLQLLLLLIVVVVVVVLRPDSHTHTYTPLSVGICVSIYKNTSHNRTKEAAQVEEGRENEHVGKEGEEGSVPPLWEMLAPASIVRVEGERGRGGYVYPPEIE